MVGRNPAIVKIQRRRIRCPPTHFALDRRAGETGRVGIDEKQRDAAHAVAAGAGGNDEIAGLHTAGDEHFLAVQHPFIAFFSGGGFHIRHVRAAARFGDAQGAAFFAGQQIRQGAGANLVIGQLGQRFQHDGARADTGHHPTGGGAAHFQPDRFAHMHIVETQPAIFFGNIETEHAKAADFFIYVMRIAARFVPIINMRVNFGFHKFAHAVLKSAAFFGLKRVQHVMPPRKTCRMVTCPALQSKFAR